MSVLLVSLGLVLSGVGPETLGSEEKSLRGIVSGKDGKPVPGAVVWACKNYENWERTRQETKTDSRGAYLLKLSPGVWEVFARTDHQVGKAVGPGLEMSVRVHENRDPDSEEILLEDCGSVRIRALAAEDGAPLSQAKIFTSNGQLLTTDARGEARACGFPDGCHGFVVCCQGRMTKEFEFSISGNQEAQVEVRVPRGGIIRGVVKDSDGVPVPGVNVGNPHLWVGLCRGIDWVKTNERGEFQMNAFSLPGTSEVIYGFSNLFNNGASRDFVSPEELLEIQLVMGHRKEVLGTNDKEKKAPRLVRGLVKDAQGKPVSGVLITWKEVNRSGYKDHYQTRSNEKGEYEVSVSGEDRYLWFFAKGYCPVSQSIEEILKDRVPCVLSSGEVAKGTLIDDQGKPIAGAWVFPGHRSEGMGNGLREIAVRTNQNGQFQLPGWTENEEIQFLLPRVGTLVVRGLTAKKLEIPIVMNRPAFVRGRLLGTDHRPVKHFVLQSWDVSKRKSLNRDNSPKYFYSSQGRTSFSSVDGSFVLAGLKLSGDYSLCCSVDGFGDADKDSVRSVSWEKLNQSERIPMQLEAGHPLKVRVNQQDGKPVSNARLTLVEGKRGAEAEMDWWGENRKWVKTGKVTTNEMGEHFYAHIGPNRGALLVQAPGLARQWIPWDKKTTEVTVKMEPEAILEVEVVNAHEGFLQRGDYRIHFSGENISSKNSISINSKTSMFRLDGLMPGKYSMELMFGLGRHYVENHIDIKINAGINSFKIDGKSHQLVNP